MTKLKNVMFATLFLLGSLNANVVVQNEAPAEKANTASYSSYYKKLKYEASLAYTKYTSKDTWWTQIAPFNIYLGALPLKNEGHLEQIIDLGVTAVLSMVEDFEIEDGWMNKPVKPQDWEENGILVKHIEAIDFLPLKSEEIDEGIEYLATMLEQGHTVYVHCKAGRGRSASIVVVYLMKYHGLAFEEAVAFVKEQRPQINLNVQQRAAIIDYFPPETTDSSIAEDDRTLTGGIYDLFQNMNEMSEEKLSVLLNNMLHYVIEGVSPSGEEEVPASLSTWIPQIEIQSTYQRRNRYLREYQGDQVAATEGAIQRNHGLIRKFKLMAISVVPFVGAPTGHSISLWHQLREITLIAALHGHDIRDPDVKVKILSCLVGGNLLKVPALTVDLIVKTIVKKIVVQVGLDAGLSSLIPSQLIFNYFTDNSAKVATHAKEVFAGVNSLPVSDDEYWIKEN